jgi:hypothetical protein
MEICAVRAYGSETLYEKMTLLKLSMKCLSLQVLAAQTWFYLEGIYSMRTSLRGIRCTNASTY